MNKKIVFLLNVIICMTLNAIPKEDEHKTFTPLSEQAAASPGPTEIQQAYQAQWHQAYEHDPQRTSSPASTISSLGHGLELSTTSKLLKTHYDQTTKRSPERLTIKNLKKAMEQHPDQLNTPQQQFKGRTPFEEALKLGNVEAAKLVYDKALAHGITEDKIIKRLRSVDEHPEQLIQIYGDISYDEARTRLLEDIKAIDPKLYQDYYDSFTKKKNKPTIKFEQEPIARIDQEYNDWLVQNTTNVISQAHDNNRTPLQEAIESQGKNFQKSEIMAHNIIDAGMSHGISAERMLKPIRDQYHKLQQEGKSQEADAYIQKAYNVLPKHTSHQLYEQLQVSSYNSQH